MSEAEKALPETRPYSRTRYDAMEELDGSDEVKIFLLAFMANVTGFCLVFFPLNFYFSPPSHQDRISLRKEIIYFAALLLFDVCMAALVGKNKKTKLRVAFFVAAIKAVAFCFGKGFIFMFSWVEDTLIDPMPNSISNNKLATIKAIVFLLFGTVFIAIGLVVSSFLLYEKIFADPTSKSHETLNAKNKPLNSATAALSSIPTISEN